MSVIANLISLEALEFISKSDFIIFRVSIDARFFDSQTLTLLPDTKHILDVFPKIQQTPFDDQIIMR